MRHTTSGAAATLLALTALTTSVQGNPRPLPFTYPYQTLAQGEGEIEQYVDMTPTKALSVTTGKPTGLSLFLFQTEFEYGLTNRLELGLYLQVAPSAGDQFAAGSAGAIDSTGVKQRLRYRIADEGVLPVDMSVYFELVETQAEIEVEGKLNLQKRFGQLRVMANLWAEHEFYFDGRNEWVLNPTLGATYQFTPLLNAGVESWMRAEYPSTPPATRPFALGPHVYVGPAIMLNFGKLWWSNGLYFHVTDAERVTQPGDAYGRIWYRTVIGLSL